MTEEERIRKFNEIVGNMHNLAPNFNLSHTLPTDILLENPSFINNPSRILEDMEQTLGLPQSELEEILNEKFNGINNPELKTKFGISDEDAQWLIDNSKDVITIKEFLKPYQERGLLIPNGKGDVTGFGYAHAARINEDGSSHVFERHYRKGDDIEASEQLHSNDCFALTHQRFVNRIIDAKKMADREHIEITSGHNKMQLISVESGVYHVRIFNQPDIGAEPILVTQFTAYDPTDETIIPMNKLPGLEDENSDKLREEKNIVIEFIRLRDRGRKQKKKELGERYDDTNLDTEIYNLNKSFLEEDHLEELYAHLTDEDPYNFEKFFKSGRNSEVFQSTDRLEKLIENTENYFPGIDLRDNLEKYISTISKAKEIRSSFPFEKNFKKAIRKANRTKATMNYMRLCKPLTNVALEIEMAKAECLKRIESTQFLSNQLTKDSYMLIIGDFITYRTDEIEKVNIENSEFIESVNHFIDNGDGVLEPIQESELPKVDTGAAHYGNTGLKFGLIFNKKNDGDKGYNIIPRLFLKEDLEVIMNRCDGERASIRERKLHKKELDYEQLNDWFMKSPVELEWEAKSLRRDSGFATVSVLYKGVPVSV